MQKATAGNKAVGEVRGLGLMIGIEFNEPDGSPSHDIADKVAAECIKNKLLVLTCGTSGHVIRLIPPLNVSDADLDKGLAILEKAIAGVK